MREESPQLQRVRDARSSLLMTHPFFGVLSLKLDIYEPENEIEAAMINNTAGVDIVNNRMAFNPAFVDTLSNAELKGLIAHEVMHPALGHHARMGSRNPKLWNLACDLAMNPVLLDDGFTLPPGGAIIAKFKGMTAEAIYEKLRDMIGEPQGGNGNGEGNGNGNGPQSQDWGEFNSPGPEGSSEANESAREWAENAAEALRAASSAGKVPASLRREIEESLKPRADWKSLLRRFMTDQVRVVQTWSKPNKRFYPEIYLPGKTKDGMGVLVIAVDTSGSIDGPTLSKFAAEITGIAADVEPACIHVVYCDAAVNHVESFEAGEDIILKAVGGGGTDFRPVFKQVEKEGWVPACLIYLTDLMGTFPEKLPAYPVLWASYGAGGAVAPLGETVSIDG